MRRAYREGVEDAIACLLERGRRLGGAVQATYTEVEIRALLLNQHPNPQHDAPRSS